MTDPNGAFRTTVRGLLRELLSGPSDAAFVLNRGDRGLLASLDRLSAEAASSRVNQGASVAAHVDHLRYGLSLLNRWARGEDPWHDADFSASWKRTTVSGEQWRSLREALAAEARDWDRAVAEWPEWTERSMTETMGSVVHLAYHLGAIRQMVPDMRGPRAND